jgi:hypothetical protein
VVDAGLPQNWEDFLPADCMDLEHAAGFGAEGWGDFHNPQNGIPGVGGHIGLFPHGVAVSSIIVGFPSEFGSIDGAAPDVRLIPIRILNQFNTAWFSWMTAGIMYAGSLMAQNSFSSATDSRLASVGMVHLFIRRAAGARRWVADVGNVDAPATAPVRRA